MSGRMGFIGVSTGQSSIRRVFPAWAELLGLPTRDLVGHDLAPGSQPTAYRSLVQQIDRDPGYHGALVTTHKLDLFDAARDLFDDLDELALTFGEVSSIYKRGGALRGAARDPLTVRLALEDFLPAQHFRDTGAGVLCLGSGGSGMALTHQLGLRADRPGTVVCTALEKQRLDHLKALHERAGLPPELFRYTVTSGPAQVDEILAGMAPGSLVVNATGLGKDRLGSPLTASAVFPKGSYVWDFNYRGSLEFLRVARAQAARRELVVEDGWRYFIHGWSQVIADVFDIPMTPTAVEELSAVAVALR